MTQPTETPDGIASLRAELFATLRGVKDKTIDLDTAKQVVAISQTIVDSARVEVDFLKATGQSAGTGFLDADKQPAKLPDGIKGSTVHRLR